LPNYNSDTPNFFAIVELSKNAFKSRSKLSNFYCSMFLWVLDITIASSSFTF